MCHCTIPIIQVKKGLNIRVRFLKVASKWFKMLSNRTIFSKIGQGHHVNCVYGSSTRVCTHWPSEPNVTSMVHCITHSYSSPVYTTAIKPSPAKHANHPPLDCAAFVGTQNLYAIDYLSFSGIAISLTSKQNRTATVPRLGTETPK